VRVERELAFERRERGALRSCHIGFVEGVDAEQVPVSAVATPT